MFETIEAANAASARCEIFTIEHGGLLTKENGDFLQAACTFLIDCKNGHHDWLGGNECAHCGWLKHGHGVKAL